MHSIDPNPELRLDWKIPALLYECLFWFTSYVQMRSIKNVLHHSQKISLPGAHPKTQNAIDAVVLTINELDQTQPNEMKQQQHRSNGPIHIIDPNN